MVTNHIIAAFAAVSNMGHLSAIQAEGSRLNFTLFAGGTGVLDLRWYTPGPKAESPDGAIYSIAGGLMENDDHEACFVAEYQGWLDHLKNKDRAEALKELPDIAAPVFSAYDAATANEEK